MDQRKLDAAAFGVETETEAIDVTFDLVAFRGELVRGIATVRRPAVLKTSSKGVTREVRARYERVRRRVPRSDVRRGAGRVSRTAASIDVSQCRPSGGGATSNPAGSDKASRHMTEGLPMQRMLLRAKSSTGESPAVDSQRLVQFRRLNHKTRRSRRVFCARAPKHLAPKHLNSEAPKGPRAETRRRFRRSGWRDSESRRAGNIPSCICATNAG